MKISRNVLKNRLFTVTIGITLTVLVIVGLSVIQIILLTNPLSEFVVFEENYLFHGRFQASKYFSKKLHQF